MVRDGGCRGAEAPICPAPGRRLAVLRARTPRPGSFSTGWYLFRTESDLNGLLPLRPNLRLVKGAYLEPATVAFAKKADVDANYLRLAERMLDGGGFTAIATHDERIIESVIGFARRRGIAKDRYEFQLLYGVRPQLQLDLVQRGFRVLIATPFGPDWYNYLMRRLAERPANVLFFVRTLRQR
ncbi:MAG: proline dehydrogenase family protein [Chloroflexota bacterium]|nr:proline dehydrogenase family protein [Chloroflexota bacterium]